MQNTISNIVKINIHTLLKFTPKCHMLLRTNHKVNTKSTYMSAARVGLSAEVAPNL